MPKRVRGTTYYHLSAVPAEVLRRVPGGIQFAFNVVRVDTDGSVCLLDYPGFDTERTPRLNASLKLSPDGTRSVRRYSGSSAPILHRKELLLSASDPRRPKWSSVTAKLERDGAFQHSTRIGTGRTWKAALQAIRNPSAPSHKTAKRRSALSVPMRALLPVLWDGCTVLDYGCGRGEDVKRLRRMGIDVDGYDPHFFPNLPRKRYDIVNLGYVLNVIQDPSERARVLQQAWELTKVALLVSVRTDAPQKGWSRSGDGYLTGTGTFQKLYAGSELLQYASRLQGGTASGGTGRVVVLRHPIGQVSRR